MRKRLLLGNVLATLVAGAIALALLRFGVNHDLVVGIAAFMIIAFTSIHSIRIVNELLRRLSRLEEAALRVSHGELDVRVGEVDPPLEGLAFRLDQVFEQLEQASSPATAGEHAPAE